MDDEFMEKLKEEFDIETEKATSVYILQSMWEKISVIKDYIEGLLNPEKYNCMVEISFFDEREKERLFSFYSKLMREHWKYLQALFGSEEERKKEIKELYEFYKRVKKFVKNLSKKMINGWGSEIKEEKNGDYIS